MNAKWYPGYYLDPRHWPKWMPEVFPHWLPASMVRRPPTNLPEPQPEPSSKPSYGLFADWLEQQRPKSFEERLAEITRAGLLPVPEPLAPQPTPASWRGLVPPPSQPTQWPAASLPASASTQSSLRVLSRWPDQVMTTAGVPAKIAGWSWDLLDNLPGLPAQRPNANASSSAIVSMPPAGTPTAGAITPNVPNEPTDNEPEIMSDETPDNFWIPGAQYAAEPSGHHWFAREHWKRIPPEALEVFDAAGLGKTGRLPIATRPSISAQFGQPPLGHYWDELHKQYNKAVGDLFERYLQKHNITREQMTADHARAVLREIAASEDRRIQSYREMITRIWKLYRLRTGIRGGSD